VTAGPINDAGAKFPPGGIDPIVDPPTADAGRLPEPAAPPDWHAGRLSLVGTPGVVLTRVAA
jgi:hypothetical protein